MARPELPLAFQKLHESPLVSVSGYTCHAPSGSPAGEEESDRNNVLLMRHGTFSKHFGRRRVTADANQSTFFSKGSTYRISHPADCGDRGTVFTVAPRILADIVRELDPTVDEHPGRPFPFVTGPCEPAIFWRHRELVMKLEGKAPIEPFWADATALQLVADVLEAAFQQHGSPRRAARSGTDADHAERAEEARSVLASRFRERITLDELSRAVNASPFHLARVFQRRTGVPIHRYLTRLRLRASLESLASGADDLTALALDLGFSSHSHFTDAFRREFGRTPSEVRASKEALGEMSKILKVGPSAGS
ncbi:MAG: helix-turn-helix transcriptional regulator [Acidobacteria bacterium]|nr:helix-turn-helix transcriptional regulator [Acidobacteriota bacterium]